MQAQLEAQKVILEMRNIYKMFPEVKALSNVDFTLREGEIHSLMGENGAGKSTLIKVLTGVYPLDSGTIALHGNAIKPPRSTREAQALGISTVYQEVNLCPNLTVAENIYIGRQPLNKWGCIDWRLINANATALVNSFGLDIDVTRNLDNYSVAIQQMVAITRAIDVSAKVLILDEPTSSLDQQETERLFEVLRYLKGQGMGIIFVSHFLDQIYALCDRVTVLRNGELVGAYELETLPRVELIAKMMGKHLDDLKDFDAVPAKGETEEEVFLEASNISGAGRMAPMDLTIHRGEVVGFAGLLGSGRTETAEMLFGAAPSETGSLKVHGKTVKIGNELDAMNLKMAFCPEDRKKQGIIGDLSVKENIILALQAKQGMFRYILEKEQCRIADMYLDMLKIKVSDREQLVKNLSGGNQQKVIIARWLASEPEFLILDEPTRGIDIGTKTEIQKMIRRLAEKGLSVVFISSEIDEMLRTASRIVVFRDQRKIAELPNDGLTSSMVMAAIAEADRCDSVTATTAGKE